jgi:hypothetical protein
MIIFLLTNIILTFPLKDANSLARELAYGLAKNRLTSTKSSSIEAKNSRQDSNSWDEPYVS